MVITERVPGNSILIEVLLRLRHTVRATIYPWRRFTLYTDQQTRKNFNRPRYTILKEDVLRSGDELIITEVDRLGRNKADTLKELQYFKEAGIRVKILELPTTLMDVSHMDNAMARMVVKTMWNRKQNRIIRIRKTTLPSSAVLRL